MQELQLAAQVAQQGDGTSRLADHKTHALGAKDRRREWAQLQADHGFLQPAARCGEDLVEFGGFDRRFPFRVF
jgi:hypothetical protein